MTPSVPTTPPSGPLSGRLPVQPVDVRKKAHARLAEKIDLARSRHKPLSLLRQDARRTVEAVIDADCPTLTRGDRDKLVEDILAESVGFGPLEELFRDDGVKEILVLAPAQVIARKGDAWVPTSARFRDADQLRAVLTRYADPGDDRAAGGIDGRLANGFRVLAVVPPEVMDQGPVAAFVRGPKPADPPATPVPSSGTVVFSARTGPATGSRSGNLGPAIPAAPTPPRPTPPPPPITAALIPPAPDPLARVRQRLTERIIGKFAAAQVYDLGQLPAAELRRIVQMSVAEFCHAERLPYDDATQERLALEILAGMNR